MSAPLFAPDHPDAVVIAETLVTLARDLGRRVTCAVAGESGVGKSTLAAMVADKLGERDCPTTLLELDDYYRLPPLANHRERVADLSRVGPGEVDLGRMQRDLDAFVAGATRLEVPIVDRNADRFDVASVALDGSRALIVAGTWALRLAVDLRIFVNGDYRATAGARRTRARDRIDAWTDRILDIEHELIRPDRVLADAVVHPTHL